MLPWEMQAQCISAWHLNPASPSWWCHVSDSLSTVSRVKFKEAWHRRRPCLLSLRGKGRKQQMPSVSPSWGGSSVCACSLTQLLLIQSAFRNQYYGTQGLGHWLQCGLPVWTLFQIPIASSLFMDVGKQRRMAWCLVFWSMWDLEETPGFIYKPSFPNK